jgi:hypothetical protein
MKLTVSITPDILAASAHCDALKLGANCAIALALKDIFPKVNVASQYARIMDRRLPSGNKLIKLTQSATDFIFKFDTSTPQERCNMQSFSFDLELPEEVIELVDIDDIKAILAKSQSLQLQ